MGQEITCFVECPAGSGEARALLESTEVVVRGAFRWKLPLQELEGVEVEGATLHLRTRGAVASFLLGDTVAAKWAEKIRNPPSRMKKLGIKPGVRVRILGQPDADFLDELSTVGATLTDAQPDLLFCYASKPADLTAVWTAAPAVWIVYSKARPELTEGQVMTSGRAAGMKDTKVASYSPTLTALRFSRPVGAA